MYVCNSCGQVYAKKQFGECSNCKAFQDFSYVDNGTATLPQRSAQQGGKKKKPVSVSVDSFSPPTPIGSVKPEDISQRISSGFSECDRVLGGGFVSGEVALLAGTPGAGKSTLSLAIAHNVVSRNKEAKVVYVSGEESVDQIAVRARRMGIKTDNILVAHDTRAEAVAAYCAEYNPVLCVVDSVQTLTVEGVNSAAGSISQSKAVADTLTLYGKRNNIVMVLISQVAKSEDFSGSNAIQHIVDVTLKLDLDKTSPLRFLRAEKNRFGATDEVGVFRHVDSGLEEVADPTQIALDTDSVQGASGTAISMLSEGARFFPVEIQALAIPSALSNPRKQFSGVVAGKAHGVCAIIDKFCKTDLSEQDVYVNTVSGIFVHSPTCDLGLAASLITSVRSVDMPTGVCYLGEVSLTGAVRNTGYVVKAATEAYRLGYTTIVVPESARKEVVASLKKMGATGDSVKVKSVKTISDLYSFIVSNGSKNDKEKELHDKAKKISNSKKYYKAKRERE